MGLADGLAVISARKGGRRSGRHGVPGRSSGVMGMDGYPLPGGQAGQRSVLGDFCCGGLGLYVGPP